VSVAGEEQAARIAALKASRPWLMILVRSWRPTAYDGWDRIQAPTVEELLDELEERYPVTAGT
jgi:hypothetical protein